MSFTKAFQKEIDAFNPRLFEISNDRIVYNLQSYSTYRYKSSDKFELYLGNGIVQIEHIPTGISFVIASEELHKSVMSAMKYWQLDEVMVNEVMKCLFQELFTFMVINKTERFFEVIELIVAKAYKRGQSDGAEDIRSKLKALLNLG